jgi:outer membrane protein OmpA-like peptidoglycan-associated protein
MPELTPSHARMHPSLPGRSSAALVTLGLTVCLAGCTGTATIAVGRPGICSDAVVGSAATVVVTATATSAEPAVALPASLRSRLRATAVKGQPTCVAIVTPQGELLAFDVTPRRPNGQVENGPDRVRKVDQNLSAIAVRMASLAQREPGLDPLKAIDTAIRLHVTPGSLVVISSGVSTMDPVDFRSTGWDFDAAEQAAELGRAHDLPNLFGWQVEFVGLGDVAGKQKPPTVALRERLRLWWTTLCRASGAKTCRVDPELIATAAPISHNVVPRVPLPGVTVSPRRMDLPNALLFAIDSAVLQPGARAGLQAVVDRAVSTGDSVRIVGHTDAITGPSGHNRELSQRRARSVATELLRLGLPTEQLQLPTGVGSDGASAVRERANPALVSRDRRVAITFQHRSA